MKSKRLAIGLIIFSICFGNWFSSPVVYANTMPQGGIFSIDELISDDYTVVAFSELSPGISNQFLQVGDSIEDITLPTVLAVHLQNGLDATIGQITWRINKPFQSNYVDTFTYTAVLPAPYEASAGINLPVIAVKINKATSTIDNVRLAITQTAGTIIYDTINIQPAFGRVLYLQNFNPVAKRWESKVTYTLSNSFSQELTIKYPAQWYTMNHVTTSWRLYAPASATANSYISPVITVNALRAYQNPIGYYQLKPFVALRSNAGYTLRYGSMGLKVAMVQRKLGLGYIWEIIGPSTSAKIKSYQQSKGLTQTGTVDYSLWKTMGFSDSTWFYKGAYVSPMKTNLSSTKQQLVEAFIANAYRYLGTEYIVGAAGEPKTGIDCSGLVMQSMYATGVDPYPISVIRHSQPGYEYESRNFWASSQLKTVPVSQRARGDLIFYQNRSGVVIHVAIYLGNNKVIESVPSGVRVADWISYPSIKGVKRVFN